MLSVFNPKLWRPDIHINLRKLKSAPAEANARKTQTPTVAKQT